MTLVPQTEISDHFVKGGISQMPWFASIFLRNRFQQILRYLHIVDNNTRPEKGHPNYKLHKVQPVIDHLNTIFPASYTPEQNLSIDEQMIRTKCRVSFIQYMPKKPERFGIKVWALCEAASAYTLQFQVYTGKTDGEIEHGLAYRVVCELAQDDLNKDYRLYFDNFYTTVELM